MDIFDKILRQFSDSEKFIRQPSIKLGSAADTRPHR